MIGRTIGQYRIVDRLASGGMGDVYKAEDIRLQRPVALKFLGIRGHEDETARLRFIQEARSASALDHPNICTIYEIEETEEGELFIAMGFYDGESLAHRIGESGPLPPDEALAAVEQVLAALGAAHERGIYHRDIKPGNIVVTPRGVVKLLDFGLAKLRGGSRITRAGLAVGTPVYMSPEQVFGREVDHRSDLWSVGVLLFELVTGEVPFDAPDDAGVLWAVAHEPPLMPPSPPPGFETLLPLIRRALQKDLEARFQSADEMLAEVRRLRQGRGGVGSDVQTLPEVTALAQPGLPSVAVLPFEDLSAAGDQEYFCAGIAAELVDALARLDGLRVASRTSAAQFRGRTLDVRTIGHQLGVGALLEGTVRKAGNRIRVTAQLTDVHDGLSLWSGRFDRELTDVFAIQDEIAHDLVEVLRGQLGAEEAAVLQRRATHSLEAYNAYLRGRHFWNRRTRDGLRRGIRFFQQAIAEDEHYASAWAGLADSWLVLGIYGGSQPDEVMPKAEAAALTALRHDPELAAAHTSLACVHALYGWNWDTAEQGFREAIRLDPAYATARQWYAMNLLIPRDRFDEAEEELEAAQELEPLSTVIVTSRGILELYRGRPEAARERLEEALELDPGFAIGHFFLGLTGLAEGRPEEALAALERGHRLSAGSNDTLAGLACALAATGKRAEAESRLEGLLERSRAGYVAATLPAQVHLALGDRAAAWEWLDRARREKAVDLVWVHLLPAFATIAAEDRFRELQEGLGLA